MSTTANKASSMAELMAKHTSPFVTVHKGDIVKATITKLTSSEILLDINAKTEAIVMEKDRKLVHAMMAALKVGDVVQAQILNPESDTGNTVVSLRRFMEQKVWDKLTEIQKNQTKIDVVVRAVTKGGYLIDTPQGVDGFLPNSHVSFKQNVQDIVGKSLTVIIAELNKENHKLIVSQKPVVGQADFDSMVKTLQVGQKVDAIVSHITAFGIFVNIPVKDKNNEETFLDGLIHISEIAWEKVTDLSGMFEVGHEVKAVIIKIDTGSKRIDLSIKQLTADPFTEASKKFAVDQKVTGTVERITEQGVIIDLGEDGVEGFIRKEKIPPTTTYKSGQELTLTVAEIDKKKHRIYLAPVLLDKPLMYR